MDKNHMDLLETEYDNICTSYNTVKERLNILEKEMQEKSNELLEIYKKQEEEEKKKTLYVVYWIDLDCYCLKKSEIEIIGVYNDEDVAKQIKESYEYRRGTSDDERCYYCRCEKITLNELNSWYES